MFSAPERNRPETTDSLPTTVTLKRIHCDNVMERLNDAQRLTRAQRLQRPTTNAATPTASRPACEKGAVRRSNRKTKHTPRGREYFNTLGNRAEEGGKFPFDGDRIQVKWILDGATLWWPATVLSIDVTSMEKEKDEITCRGAVIYKKLGKYSAETTEVLFSSNTKLHTCFVRSLPGPSEFASWVFSVDSTLSTGSSDAVEASEQEPVEPAPATDSDQRVMAASRPRRRSGETRNVVDRNSRAEGSSQMRDLRTIVKRRLSGSSFKQQVLGSQSVPPSTVISPSPESEHPSASRNSSPVGDQPTQSVNRLELRLSLVESHLASLLQTPGRDLPQATQAVLVSLRWALVKSLEKPLKDAKLPELVTHGLAADTIKVKCDCDFASFQNIAQNLENKYSTSDGSYLDSRVAFAPPFQAISSGSQSMSDLSVVFASFSDLSALIGVKDERDLEHMLVKEVTNENASYLRLLGTFSTEFRGGIHRGESEAGSSSSISETSALGPKRIELYVGSAPVKRGLGVRTPPRMPTEPREGPNELGFRSILFTQRCEHFSPAKMCFQKPWVPRSMRSKFNVTCQLEPDGDIGSEKILDHFVISWSRLTSPSKSKWTLDMMDTQGNVPGVLSLSIPIVYFNSRHNIRALSSVLDNFFEDIMDLHKELKIH